MPLPLNSGPAAHSEPEGVWPARRRPTLDWLMLETRTQPFIDNIFVEMCSRLVTEGVPIDRATLHFSTRNPSGWAPASSGYQGWTRPISRPSIMASS